MIWTFAKDMPSPLVWLYLPQHVLFNVLVLLGYARLGRSRLVLQAKLDAIRGLPAVLSERRLVQGRRVASSQRPAHGHGEGSRRRFRPPQPITGARSRQGPAEFTARLQGFVTVARALEAAPDAVEVSVVIPCLNEEEGVGGVVRAAWQGIERLGLSGEVIVADNGSTDRSVEIAESEGATVIHEEQRGYGSAYLAGPRRRARPGDRHRRR